MLKRTLFPLLSLLLCAILFLTGVIFLPETGEESPSFEEEKASLEEALTLAKKEAAEVDIPSRQEAVFFYESALLFGLSPYSSPFASEALSARARCLVRGEETHRIDSIIEKKDGNALADLLEEERLSEGILTAEETKAQKEEDLLLFSLPGNVTPARSALIYEVRLLKESLRQHADLYRGTEKELTKRDQREFQALLSLRNKSLLSEKAPLLSNTETLYGSERLAALLICLVTLLYVSTAKENAPLSLEKQSALFLLSLIVVSALTLFFATALFAPQTAKESHLFFFGQVLTAPFFPALFLRLCLRCLWDSPAILFCLSLRKSKRAGKRALCFLPLGRYLLLGVRVVSHGTLYQILSLFEPAEIAFPLFFAHSEKTPPLILALTFWALIFGVFFFIKKRKRS